MEAKVPYGAAEVDKVLGTSRLGKVLEKLARKAAVPISKLPQKPKRLVVDGGITQAPALLVEQKKESGIPLSHHTTHDGTALGIAKMLIGR